MSVVWPPTLPANQFIGLLLKRQKSFVRTEMDAGPSKQRRRFTAASQYLTTHMRLNNDQKATFDTFYNTSLEEGSLSFQWTDPRSDATVNMRFMEVPEFRLLKGGPTTGDDQRYWETVLSLEIIP